MRETLKTPGMFRTSGAMPRRHLSQKMMSSAGAGTSPWPITTSRLQVAEMEKHLQEERQQARILGAVPPCRHVF